MPSAPAIAATLRSSAHLPSCRAQQVACSKPRSRRSNESCEHPARPFVAIVGGAKVADKLGVLRSLAERADRLLLGGAMCFTFLAALGHEVGASHLEPTLIDEARSLLTAYPETVLPTDFTVLGPGTRIGEGDGSVQTYGRRLAAAWQGMDIGPATSAAFSSEIAQASTVLWNGPMGVFEDPRFAAGTRAVAEAVASCGGFTVVGGGDTVAALHEFGLEDRIGHLSSGGGATLELLEYGDLPGIAALRTSARVRRDPPASS